MAIHVALNHVTHYKYDRPVTLGPHVIRLRPAPHTRTPILSYSLTVTPGGHFLNWQQDPQSNWQARVVYPKKVEDFRVEVALVAEMSVLDPFDFFLEEGAMEYPFLYDHVLDNELAPFLHKLPLTPLFEKFVKSLSRKKVRTIDFLVSLNMRLKDQIKYAIRMEPGVQTPEQTLELELGSCRDTGWLLVQALRHMGLAARFVSGYLIQLTPDIKSLDGPVGASTDFTDLHAWAEVYLPGAGWIGLDPTSGLLAGEGHIPLACSPEPSSAAAISGALDECETEFEYSMTLTRIHESPRVTKPYTEDQWKAVLELGNVIDESLKAGDVRLTMGGEPTFVSSTNMEGDEWNFTALSPEKALLGCNLLKRMQGKFAPGSLLHFGQGKWYPGESLPRWAYTCYWRKDGTPIWEDQSLVGNEGENYGYTDKHAGEFMGTLAEKLGLDPKYVMDAYEDAFYYMWKERRLPINVDPFESNLKNKEDRKRLAKIFEQGLEKVVGKVLPIQKPYIDGEWVTGPWFLRPERMYLIPGDSPVGFRLPLDSLPWVRKSDYPHVGEQDPSEPRGPLPARRTRTDQPFISSHGRSIAGGWTEEFESEFYAGEGEGGPGGPGIFERRRAQSLPPRRERTEQPMPAKPMLGESAPNIVRTAMAIEPRDGRLFVFMPPTYKVEDYLEIVQAIEETASSLKYKVQLEGYTPPSDHRIQNFKVTPDPGVIEVNLQPTATWEEQVNLTTTLYQEARAEKLTAEKFMKDGRHVGTGGGNHIIIGGETPKDSPVLRRPDLLRSLVSYWHNHPSLSYLFSGLFVGPTSQAPRVDEARNDSLYEMELAFKQIPEQAKITPWLTDRLMRNLLIDVSGNTHRAEFCIDKLYSPDSSSGRLGLVELRAFEMPPHERMALTQSLLLRALVARFWDKPYTKDLVRWGTELHDRFMLPHFVDEDFGDVIAETREHGFAMEKEWFDPHLAFRFPKVGHINHRGVEMELRTALEPWHVLGEEPGTGGTVRYVDSSLERAQVKVTGMVSPRHVVTCNGVPVPLHPTGTNGEYVAGIRYRAWQPPTALQPTIGIHSPLTLDLVDTWSDRAVAGCRYYVEHPGGRNSANFPINAYEAESRRLARFFAFGHTPGEVKLPPVKVSPEFPFTLDLRTY